MLVGVAGDEQRPGQGSALQAGRQVNGAAGNGVFTFGSPPGDHRPGVDAYPHLESPHPPFFLDFLGHTPRLRPEYPIQNEPPFRGSFSFAKRQAKDG